MTIKEAAKDAGLERLRPILLTSITTIVGLIPLAFGIGGESPMWQPIAVTFVFGLSFSTMLTLFIIPSMMIIYYDILKKLGFYKEKEENK
jgi:HAE1 family hydrophobic/amphiphilic exporter-1